MSGQDSQTDINQTASILGTHRAYKPAEYGMIVIVGYFPQKKIYIVLNSTNINNNKKSNDTELYNSTITTTY